MCKGNNININIIKTKKNCELTKNNIRLKIHPKLNDDLKISSQSLYREDVSEIFNKTNISNDEKNLIGIDSFKEILDLIKE